MAITYNPYNWEIREPTSKTQNKESIQIEAYCEEITSFQKEQEQWIKILFEGGFHHNSITRIINRILDIQTDINICWAKLEKLDYYDSNIGYDIMCFLHPDDYPKL